MSNDIHKQLTSVVIFDRTNPDASDVPVFSRALKQKVNTPVDTVVSDGLSIKTQAILASFLSSSRADSSGGQTGGFAQGEERQEKTSLYEEPTLIRPIVATEKVHSFIESSVPQVISIPKLQEQVPLVEALPEVPKNQIDTAVSHPFYEELVWKLLTATLKYLGREIPKVLAFLQLLIEVGVHLISRFIRFAVAFTRTQVKIIQARAEDRREMRKARQQIDLSHVIDALSSEAIAEPKSTPPKRKIEFSFPKFSFFEVIGKTIIRAGEKVWESIRAIHFYSLASKLMIAGSLVLMLLTVGPMVALQVQSWKEQISYSLHNMASRADDSQPTPVPLVATPTPTPTPNPDPEKQFQIVIPKIGVNSKVIANVDPGSEKDYDEALKKGVAHAAGTGLPGEKNEQNKTVFIFGHSTNGTWNISRYNALFYSLKDMSVGDTLSVWFWGREFHYTVSETKIVEAKDVSFLIPQTTTDQLILQTCWPPGTSWKRFLVIAKPS